MKTKQKSRAKRTNNNKSKTSLAAVRMKPSVNAPGGKESVRLFPVKDVKQMRLKEGLSIPEIATIWETTNEPLTQVDCYYGMLNRHNEYILFGVCVEVQHDREIVFYTMNDTISRLNKTKILERFYVCYFCSLTHPEQATQFRDRQAIGEHIAIHETVIYGFCSWFCGPCNKLVATQTQYLDHKSSDNCLDKEEEEPDTGNRRKRSIKIQDRLIYPKYAVSDSSRPVPTLENLQSRFTKGNIPHLDDNVPSVEEFKNWHERLQDKLNTMKFANFLLHIRMLWGSNTSSRRFTRANLGLAQTSVTDVKLETAAEIQPAAMNEEPVNADLIQLEPLNNDTRMASCSNISIPSLFSNSENYNEEIDVLSILEKGISRPLSSVSSFFVNLENIGQVSVDAIASPIAVDAMENSLRIFELVGEQSVEINHNILENNNSTDPEQAAYAAIVQSLDGNRLEDDSECPGTLEVDTAINPEQDVDMDLEAHQHNDHCYALNYSPVSEQLSECFAESIGEIDPLEDCNELEEDILIITVADDDFLSLPF